MFNPKIKASTLENLDLDQYLDLVEELSKIDRDRVDDELANFTAYFSYYYGLQVKAKRMLDHAVVTFDTYTSCRKTEIRKSHTTGRLTVEALNDKVTCEDESKTLHNNVVKFEEIYGLMRGICLTLEHKKDMLVQLSANKRQEIKLH